MNDIKINVHIGVIQLLHHQLKIHAYRFTGYIIVQVSHVNGGDREVGALAAIDARGIIGITQTPAEANE